MYANPAQWAAGGGWQNHFTNQSGEGNHMHDSVVFSRLLHLKKKKV